MKVTELVTVPETESPVLESIKKNKAFLSNFTKRLDIISADIKAVESALKDSGLCIPFHFVLDRKLYTRNSTGEFFYEVKTLSWIKSEGGSFRVMYGEGYSNSNEDKDRLRVGVECVHDFEDFEIRTMTPVFETQADIRYGLRDCLHHIIPSVVLHFSLNPEADIPF